MPRTLATKRFPQDANCLDTFTRADSTTTMGGTETANLVWQKTSGTWGISTNQAYSQSGTTDSYAYIDVGSADIDVSVKITAFTGANEQGLCFRLVDTNNFYRLLRSTATTLLLQKRTAGSYTTIKSVTKTMANGDVFRVRAYGDSIMCYLNGSLVISTVNSGYNTATKHGFGNGTGNSTARFDDFQISY